MTAVDSPPAADSPYAGSADPRREISGSAREPRARLEQLVAIVSVVLVAVRVDLPHELTVGDVVAAALLPVWLPHVRRYRAALPLMGLALLCIPFGLLLTIHSSPDHTTSRGLFLGFAVWVVGVVVSVGLLLWARDLIGSANVVILFGLGMLLGIDPGSDLFASNPWKFGFSVPATVLVLGLALKSGRRWLELLLMLVLTAVCLVTDSRSELGILMLASAAMAWQLRPTAHTRPGSAVRVLLGSTFAIVGIYFVGQALILAGAFGASTQARSQAQVESAGSLIVGGRPELLATLHLIADNPLGPGAGARPNFHEVSVAKAAMAQIQYNPNNGYVEHSMFGSGYSLHSMFGDLWAQWGLLGLVFTLVLVATVVWQVALGLARRNLSAVTLYLSSALLWNVFFAPWYSSFRLLELLLAVLLTRRTVATRGRAPAAFPLADAGHRTVDGTALGS